MKTLSFYTHDENNWRKIFTDLRAGIRAVASLVVAAFLFATPAHAAGTQKLQGQVPAAAARLQPAGSLSGSQRLHLAIGLPLRNQSMLTNLLQQIYNPASPHYRHFLTPEQFVEIVRAI
jgi:kumamolisin